MGQHRFDSDTKRRFSRPRAVAALVRLLADGEPSRRPQDMARVLELLALVDTEPDVISGISNEVLQEAKNGDHAAAIAVLGAAADYLDDGPFFIDELAHVVGPGLEEFVESEVATSRTLVRRMEYHLVNEPWNRRNFDHYNVPLRWIQRIAEAAATQGELDLMEDAAEALFRQDARLDRLQAEGS